MKLEKTGTLGPAGWLALLITLCITSLASSCTEIVIGQSYEYNVSLTSPVALCIRLNSSQQSQSADAIRVLVSSVHATTRHPVLITVRQPMGVVSWALPYVESGFAYSSVQRTLCPRLNMDHSNVTILLDLSTSEPLPLHVSLSTHLTPFTLDTGQSVTVTASPSGPSYLLYQAPPTTGRVRVQFQSSDNTSLICAIASIQKAYCPVVELLDNPDHRGQYQTMRSKAAINTKVPVNGSFYVVVTVFPSDGRDGGCVYREGGLAGEELIQTNNLGDNFNPQLYSAQDRTKSVTITVEYALSDSGYAIAIVVSTIIYIAFYIVAVVWILVFDWWRFDTHFIFKQIQSNPEQFAEAGFQTEDEETPVPQDDDSQDPQEPVRQDSQPVRQVSQPVRDDSSDEEEENYTAPPQMPIEEPDFSLRNSLRGRGQAHHQSDASGRMVKRPSMLSVMFGKHLNDAIDEVTPPGSHLHHPFPNGRSRHNSENFSFTPATSPHGGRTRYASESLSPANQRTRYADSLNPTNLAPMRFKRQKSVSESYATPTGTHSLTASLGRHLSVSRDVVRLRKAESINSPDKTDNGQIGEGSVAMTTTEVSGESIRRQDSYEAAVEGLEEEEGETGDEYYKFPVNACLADVGTIDDSAFVQKKYNRYALYLLVIIVFYSIPAYQLVITFQRLHSSGNEDICYFNSLCSHPWDVYTGLSLSAFNNIFSNFGFFILGFLYILITYRRRVIYRSFERYNCNKDTGDRVGVPQHFGIYYAVGLALMAEALMSVAYHICPSSTNYQFDTTFMYILAALGLHKLLESRCPDLEAGLHKIMLTLAFIIVVVVVGVLYSEYLAFWVIFFLIYVVFSFVFSVEVYYRWQLKPRSARHLFRLYKDKGVCPPRHMPKFVMAVISVLVNWCFAIGLVGLRPVDFGTFFLFILLSNFIMYLLYYAITKMVYGRERPSVRPLAFVIMAIIFWIAAIFFYTRTVTDWSVTPAMSRDNNTECLLLGFYDAHDMWHFTAAFALFFSFLMLMTLDDRQEDKPRKELRVF